MGRGKLIVIEGTDGSGKQTQSERLVERLRGESYSCEVLGFPRYDTPTGKIVGEACLGKELGMGSGGVFPNFAKLDPRVACHYYAADRLDAVPEIERLLNENDFVILDRYVESNMGHQCGKIDDKTERDLMRDWIVDLEYNVNGLPQPDLIIFLYMPLKVSRRLKEGMNEKLDAHEADEEHLRNAEAAYLELAEYYGWDKVECSQDNENPRDIQDIHEEVYSLMRE
jgi:dTMP kinase